MQECFPKHSCKGTARMKQDKETEGECKKQGVSIERSSMKISHEKKSPDGLTIAQAYRPLGVATPQSSE